MAYHGLAVKSTHSSSGVQQSVSSRLGIVVVIVVVVCPSDGTLSSVLSNTHKRTKSTQREGVSPGVLGLIVSKLRHSTL